MLGVIPDKTAASVCNPYLINRLLTKSSRGKVRLARLDWRLDAAVLPNAGAWFGFPLDLLKLGKQNLLSKKEVRAALSAARLTILLAMYRERRLNGTSGRNWNTCVGRGISRQRDVVVRVPLVA